MRNERGAAVKKMDPAVKSNCLYVAAVTLILSVLMQAVFLVGGWWDYTVLLGNLWGAIAAILNFFLLAVTVTHAVEREEKEAGQLMRASQAARLFLQFIFAIIGAVASVFHTVAVLLPLLFPRIALSLYPLIARSAARQVKGKEKDDRE